MTPPKVEEFRAQIEAALAYSGGTHNFTDIQHAIGTGSLQFWPGVRSAVITEILQYPQKRVLNFFLAGGDLSELQAMYPHILAWGRERGCSCAVFTGRRGWSRTFLTRQEGWTERLSVFEKEM